MSSKQSFKLLKKTRDDDSVISELRNNLFIYTFLNIYNFSIIENKGNKKFVPETMIPQTLKLKQGKQKESWIVVEVRKSKSYNHVIH